MAKLKGCQTPSRSVFLEHEENTTEYIEATKLYAKTGRKPKEWQEKLLKHIMSKNTEGLWTYTKFGYSVPRRNGKSEILIMRILYGLEHGEQILYTAHRTTTSHSFFERTGKCMDALGYVKASEVRKEDNIPEDKQYTSYKANGLESIGLNKTDGRINFRTRTAKGGLGEGYDLLVIDEAQEYQDDQESSLKYVVTDSRNPQTIMCGTPPTAVSSGTIFVKYRESSLAGNVKHAGWAEWSVDVMTDPGKKEAWAQTNPSLGTILTERSIEDEVGTDDTDFNIQRLGLWIRYNQKSAVSETLWGGLRVDSAPALTGKLHVGVKFGKSGENAALSVAAKMMDGRIFVEALFCRKFAYGTGWVIDFLKKSDYAKCFSDGQNGERMLLDGAMDAKLKNVKAMKVSQVISANAAFEQGLYSGVLCHSGQRMLSEIVTNCRKRAIGSGGGFGYEPIVEGMEIAVMDSMIYAFWSCQTSKDAKPQRVTY